MSICARSAAFLMMVCLLSSACQRHLYKEKEIESENEAAEALDAFSFARSYPFHRISTTQLEAAYQEKNQNNIEYRNGNSPASWTPLGPKNMGGRTLCLAFHPQNPDIVFVGSASGGLWKTKSAGVGENAWVRVPTGFPALGIASIAIDPKDANTMYIGTGEVYNYQNASPNVAIRTTRGSYGIGILKTTDGGKTWVKSLDLNPYDFCGVQKIIINPLNTNVLYAATTEGLFKSNNAGRSWSNIDNKKMAMDLEMSPLDTANIFVTHGSLDNDDISGIYNSKDGGKSFRKLIIGLPQSYSGKAMLAFSPSSPSIIYASIADADASRGLFRTSDGGLTWSLVNNTDVALYQGWYSHDIAVHNTDPNTLMWVGVDVFKVTNSGKTAEQKSYWEEWTFGQTAVGAQEGSELYVHADIHGVYYHPNDPNTIFFATDGGIFVTKDAGETFESRNGGYQTTQFYANFANSEQDSTFAVGGLQDNATAIYTGSAAWARAIGGDGTNAAINPKNDSIVYGANQNLGVYKSTNRGKNFVRTLPQGASGEEKNFNAPYEIVPNAENVMYYGVERLFRSTDGGVIWIPTSTVAVDNKNPILRIAISPFNSENIFVSTVPSVVAGAKILESINGGRSWRAMSGLPDRLAMQIVFHPKNENILYAVFSGFKTNHVYRTDDGGNIWYPVDKGLPDVPANTIVVDPNYPNDLYLGNDLGVYYSPDGGKSWQTYSQGLPDAVIVMHLSISKPNGKLRVATYGNGMYETKLFDHVIPTSTPNGIPTQTIDNQYIGNIKCFPNPVTNILNIEYKLNDALTISLKITDAQGRLVKSIFKNETKESGDYKISCDLTNLASGIYFYVLEAQRGTLIAQKSDQIIKM